MTTSSSKKITTYSITLNDDQMLVVENICMSRGFSPYTVQYALFAFKGDGLSIVGYKSGKLVVQGKNTEDFVQFEIETNVTHCIELGYESVAHPEWFELHAGMDESGKGDLFGPLVTACVIAGGCVVEQWIKDGVRDSKNVTSDRAITALEKKILASDCTTNVMCLNMKKYNELYKKFGNNMNILLGWMHSCSLQNALQERPATWGMLDQFSKRPIVQGFLKDKSFDLRMQTKAEADPVVAAASILARAEYNRQMTALSQKAGITLSKGAGRQTIVQAQQLAKIFGMDNLDEFLKTHFATAPCSTRQK